MSRIVLAAALCAGTATAAEAAETRTTFVATRQGDCQGETNCSVHFARTVAGKRLEIENVACSASGSAAMVVTNPFVSAQKSAGAEVFRTPLPPLQKHGEQYGQALYGAHYTGLIPIVAGQYAQIAFYAKDTTFIRMTCTISGHLYSGVN